MKTNTRNTAILIVLLLFLAAIHTAGVIALTKIENLTKVNIRNELMTVLATTHESIYIWFEHRVKDIQEVAASPEIISTAESLLEMPRDPQQLMAHSQQSTIRAFMKPLLEKNGDLGIFIIAPDSISLASMRDKNVGSVNLIALNRPDILRRVFDGETCFVPTIRSDVQLSGKQKSSATAPPTIFIATPIYKNGHVIAAFTIRLDPEKTFTRIAALGRIGESGESYAFDEEGTLITDIRFKHIVRNIGFIRPNENPILNLRIADPGINLIDNVVQLKDSKKLPLTEMAQSATNGSSGVNISGYNDYRGVKVFGAWLWDELLGFGLTTEMDVAEAMAPYNQTRQIFIILLVFLTVAFLLFITILNHIQRLSEARLRDLNSHLEERVLLRTRDLEEAQSKLSEANRVLEGLATTDGLTGLANRRVFDEFLINEWNRCMRSKDVITIAMIDIDYFKRLNDHYGHQVGDECLKRIGFIFKNNRFLSRPGDLIARYGGEEFAFVLSGTTRDDAQIILNKVQSAIMSEAIPHEKNGVEGQNIVTLSIGFYSEVPMQENSLSQMLSRADEALYFSKQNGRNQVTYYCDFKECGNCTGGCFVMM